MLLSTALISSSSMEPESSPSYILHTVTVLYCTVLYCTVHGHEVVLHLNIQRSFSSLVPLTAMFTATMNSCSHSFHQTEDIKKQVQTLKSIPPLLSSSIIRKSWSTRNLLSLSGLIFFSYSSVTFFLSRIPLGQSFLKFLEGCLQLIHSYSWTHN